LGLAKLDADVGELTPAEKTQYEWHLWRHVNLWELAYDRHADGFLSDEKWATWQRAFELEIVEVSTGMPEEMWEWGREGYGRKFAALDSVYARIK
jgi:hypothetical protein